MGEETGGSRRPWLAVLLALAGVGCLVMAILARQFTCFMVTDPACQSSAVIAALGWAAVGLVLITVAAWRLVRRPGGKDRSGPEKPPRR